MVTREGRISLLGVFGILYHDVVKQERDALSVMCATAGFRNLHIPCQLPSSFTQNIENHSPSAQHQSCQSSHTSSSYPHAARYP